MHSKSIPHHSIKLLYLLLILPSIIISAPLENPYKVDPQVRKYLLTSHLEILEDPEAKISPQEINLPQFNQDFIRSENKMPYFRWTQSAFWVRFGLRNTSLESSEKRIVFNFQFVDTLETYLEENGILKLLQKTGRHFPFSRRPIKCRNYCIPIKIPPNSEIAVYHRIRTTENLTIPIYIWEPEAYIGQYQNRLFAYGVFYGITSFVFFLILILFILFKERYYLYYALMILFAHIFFTMGRQGLSQIYLFPYLPYFASLLHLSFGSVGSIFMLLLAKSFLNYKFRYKFWSWIFYLQIINLSILTLLPFLIGYQISTHLLHNTTMLSMTTILLISINKVIRMRSIPAIYFLIAWIFHLLGALTILLHSWGILTDSLLGENGYQIGITVEMILISIAMAYTIFFERKEKNIALEKSIRSQQESLENLKQSIQSKIQELQAKIKPHFLYNIINSISHLTRNDPLQAEKSLLMLSDFYRIILKFSQNKLVKLSEEMELVNLYVALEKIRFGDIINFSQSIDKVIEDFEIPGMIIQPLVENSVKHGITKKKGGGHIWVSAKKEIDTITILVKDDGIGWPDDPTSSGHGLINIQERLKLIFGDEYKMNIQSSEGVSVEIILPLEGNYDL